MKDLIKHEVKKNLLEFQSSDEYQKLIEVSKNLPVDDAIDKEFKRIIDWSETTIRNLLIRNLVLLNVASINTKEKQLSPEKAEKINKATGNICNELINELDAEASANKIKQHTPPYLKVVK